MIRATRLQTKKAARCSHDRALIRSFGFNTIATVDSGNWITKQRQTRTRKICRRDCPFISTHNTNPLASESRIKSHGVGVKFQCLKAIETLSPRVLFSLCPYLSYQGEWPREALQMSERGGTRAGRASERTACLRLSVPRVGVASHVLAWVNVLWARRVEWALLLSFMKRAATYHNSSAGWSTTRIDKNSKLQINRSDLQGKTIGEEKFSIG